MSLKYILRKIRGYDHPKIGRKTRIFRLGWKKKSLGTLYSQSVGQEPIGSWWDNHIIIFLETSLTFLSFLSP